jgi:hypothetical protein
MAHYKKHQIRLSRRKTAQKHAFRWLWIGGIVSAAIVIAMLLSHSSSGTVAKVEGLPVQGAPRVSVAQDTFDYGSVKLGQTIETVFRLRNTGEQPLVILNQPQVQVVAGCCPPRAVLSSRIIKPGEEGTVTLAFTMHEGMGGQHRFDIHLQTNDPSEPDKLLVVLSNWI